MAQTTGNHIPLFHASQVAISYIEDASALDFSGSLVALTSVTDNQVIMVKDFTLTLPKEEATKIDLMGLTSTTRGTGVLNTGTFQNAFYDIGAGTEAEISGTMALTIANDGTNAKLPDFLDLSTGTGQAISTTHHRHTFGDEASGQAKQLSGAIFVVFDNGNRAGVAALYKPIFNWEEIKLTGSDGHAEVSFTAKCLPCNFALEVEDLD